MENKLKVWIARDKDGELKVYCSRPIKDTIAWRYSEKDWGAVEVGLDRSKFPSVKWEDKEPTEAYIYITLAEPQSKQEQSKQEQSNQDNAIDWEQRRYEIAKEMLPVLYQYGAEILKCGKSVTWKDAVNIALNFADMLIQKLKEQSE